MSIKWECHERTRGHNKKGTRGHNKKGSKYSDVWRGTWMVMSLIFTFNYLYLVSEKYNYYLKCCHA
jgi:hypothetical protein